MVSAGDRSTPAGVLQEAGVQYRRQEYTSTSTSTGVQYRRQEAEVHQHQHSRLLAHSHLQLCRVQSLMSDLPLVVDPNTNHILDFDSLPFMTRVQNVFSFRKIFATSVQAGVQFLYPCELCIVCSPCAMLSENMIFCLVVLGGGGPRLVLVSLLRAGPKFLGSNSRHQAATRQPGSSRQPPECASCAPGFCCSSVCRVCSSRLQCTQCLVRGHYAFKY